MAAAWNMARSADSAYAAFLRGVSPMNAKMPELKRAFERAGFRDVRTLLSSGNIVFNAPDAAVTELEQRAELAMQEHLDVAFMTFVRPISALRRMLASNPYGTFELQPLSKRIVTFLRRKAKVPTLPVERDGARILLARGTEIFSAYVPTPRGPVFMQILEKHFGKENTTRTWETIQKTVRAASA
jgi:uncharacterized protein (DUF1697 family)